MVKENANILYADLSEFMCEIYKVPKDILIITKTKKEAVLELIYSLVI